MKKTTLYEKKKNTWPEHVLNDLLEEIDATKERIATTKEAKVEIDFVLHIIKKSYWSSVIM